MSLYRVPQDFQDRLEQEFGDKLRIRWSDQWDEWQIEQKVRNHLVGRSITEDRFSDDVIRYKDGFVWVMSFKQGTQFPCPKCGLSLKCVSRRSEMVSCRHCQLKGYEHRWLACHWPMDETLIDHLKKLEKNIDLTTDQLHRSTSMLQKQMHRNVLDPVLDRHRDDFDRLVGNLKVGYGGMKRFEEKT